MSATLVKGSGYFSTAFEPRELRRRARKELAGIQFDTVVGTGVSGVLPLQTLATAFKVNLMVVRKMVDLDNSHCDSIVEGSLDKKWLFVDDFCATGATFARCWEAIDTICRYAGHSHECVGAFLYENLGSGDFIALKTAKRLYPRVMKAVVGEAA